MDSFLQNIVAMLVKSQSFDNLEHFKASLKTHIFLKTFKC